MKNIAWIVSHPIQYYSPLYNKISESNEFDLTVYYLSDFSVKGYVDKEFNREIKWDIPLLDGHKYKFLKNNSFKKTHGSFFSYIHFDFIKEIKEKKFDLVVIHGWSSLSHLIAIFTCIATNTPYALRGDTNAFDINRKLTLKNKLRNRLLSYIFNKASALFYIGEENKKFYKSFGVKESQLIKMPFAINNDYFEAFNFDLEEKRKKLEIAPNQKVILFTGKLISIKQPKLLIESLKGIDRNKYLLLIVGDGELLNECKLLATKLNINCKFLGFINQTEIPKFYHLSDIYILPSSKEAWGLAVNEAMNCNCAIIASDKVGSSKDLVKNNGFIFDSSKVEELTYSIEKLISDDNLLEKFKLESKEIIKNFSFEKDLEALKNYFKKKNQ